MTNTIFEKFNVAELTTQQVKDLKELESFIQTGLKAKKTHVAVVEGAAGTGKSVLLTALFRKLQSSARSNAGAYTNTKNYFAVNHPELLKVYQEMSMRIPELRQKDYVRPTSLINQLDKTNEIADVVVIDEGHLLLSKSEPYIKFMQDNQLAEIVKRAKVVVVVFDFKQVMQSKMMWSPELLRAQLNDTNVKTFKLGYQHRVQGSVALNTWLTQLGNGELRPIPNDLGGYDVRMYNRADELFKQIQARDAELGLSRVVATTGFVRRHADEHNVYMDGFDLPWDEYDPQKTPWAERPESLHEVGSIYTVQGFDLNYVGVILSPAYEYDDVSDSIVINPDKVTHREIYKRRNDVTNPADIARLEQAYMMNALHVLVTRGIHGMYLTAADPKLRERLLKL
ncbi:DUF2075 domain-containing protein [Weissella tructae]|uniref:Thymidine kinase n=2 Tax=Weissella TaxID=46255 RepID=A0A075U087_9LACO|nr:MULTISPECIES: DUF2075 domain-containing protein [Weissella]AIG65901.1 Thymidine kinase [Weissella tructae]AIM63280.1 Thymidine kinase [Weissella ceti]AIM64614.1 Thymidine kinase [Weissella ceti]ELA07272.1 thymidine kinase [Weissella ceti NC36]QVV91060.1 DUF2075 domain-containing protein [Weissella tructae]